ncbi:MAG: lipoprotein-releasing system ATP-binding protein LolD [endosymbiont of Galathealinum brachiosum]|uniref:Lipoprotein-releasing system ATP-binding protein LolD n=1 Tax=endosymbiont of Galathealinum brachiosum TaxID=2200906 RepID=A0A370DMI6_9GAMM|nr:MAG: lipoprotein-releasing system ATP-binding protein LolD [endosymbiont of Galathealinum brachiosum]
MPLIDRFTDSQIFPNGTGAPIVLEAVDLSMTFSEGGGSYLEVLKSVNLTIKAGEKIAIVGASGSGKSTLLHLLGGLDDPTSGQVFVDEKNLFTMSEKERCNMRNNYMGFVYQFHHLLAEFTAEENVAMPALVRGTSPSQALSKADMLLEKVGMTGRLKHKPAELSGGERQRAAIARAVINEPRCIFADEPTGNLDKATADQVVQVLLRLNKEFGTSLVVITHDMELAKKMDTIYTIESGHLKKL